MLNPRFINFYKSAAVILLNTLLLLVMMELFAWLALGLIELPQVRKFISTLTSEPNDMIVYYQELPYYVEQDWASDYWRELKASLSKTYSPYVIWRSPPFQGKLLNINQGGLRDTPSAECNPGAYTVYVFGGSSIWGWGSPDWGTIPALLQSRLTESHSEPVCVVNYGENAYVSTQSLIQLILLIESGNIPDYVIFYDGVNEVFAADQSGIPIVHQNLSEIKDAFENTRPPSYSLIERFKSYQLLQMILAQTGFASHGGVEPDQNNVSLLSDQITQAYLQNYLIVDSLAKSYDFQYSFLWQPYILIGNKNLAQEEKNIISGLNWVHELSPGLIALFTETYQKISDSAADHANLIYFGNLFDHIDRPVWIDTWGHLTPEGNEIVALEIFRIMIEAEQK